MGNMALSALKLMDNEPQDRIMYIREGSGQFTVSLNTIQRLNAGQNVTMEWDGSGYIYDSSRRTHWTGEFLGSGVPLPPACEFTGQTFEYPGSCRKYWLCLADGTVDVFDCCPDVYVPDAQTCLSEDLVIVDAVCHSEDVCTDQ